MHDLWLLPFTIYQKVRKILSFSKSIDCYLVHIFFALLPFTSILYKNQFLHQCVKPSRLWLKGQNFCVIFLLYQNKLSNFNFQNVSFWPGLSFGLKPLKFGQEYPPFWAINKDEEKKKLLISIYWRLEPNSKVNRNSLLSLRGFFQDKKKVEEIWERWGLYCKANLCSRPPSQWLEIAKNVSFQLWMLNF